MSAPGRPTTFRPEYAELARNYCQLGATNAQLSGFFKVAPRTIDNWIVNFPEFGAAVRETRIMADERVWRAVFERSIGYNYTAERTVLYKGEERTLTKSVHCPADMRAAMIWLRNRSKWLEMTAAKPSTEPTVGADPSVVDEAEPADDEADDGAVIPDPGFARYPEEAAAFGPDVECPLERGGNAAELRPGPDEDTEEDRVAIGGRGRPAASHPPEPESNDAPLIREDSNTSLTSDSRLAAIERPP